MRKLWSLLAFLIVSTAWAAKPVLIQQKYFTGLAATYDANVTSGNLLYVGTNWIAGCTTPTIGDTLTTVFTKVQSAAFNTTNYTAVWYGVASSGGADTVTVTCAGATGSEIHISEFGNVGAFDTSDTKTFASGTPLTSNSFNTAENSELILADVGGASDGYFYSTAAADILFAFDDHANSIAALYRIAGAAGANTVSIEQHSCTPAGMVVLAFKTTGFQVLDTAVPDATKSVAYTYTLSGLGGVGAYAWSKSAGVLPPGLTLSVGGVISGTPTAFGTYTFTAKITDGTAATTTKALSLRVGDTASTAAVVQAVQTHGSTTAAFVSNVTTGNLLLISELSVLGGYTSVNQTFPTDTLSTPFRQLCEIENVSVILRYYIGTLGGSGADTVTILGMVGASAISAVEMSGVQGIPDGCALTSGSTATGTITSAALATSATNELVLGIAGWYDNSATFTADAPFTLVGSPYYVSLQKYVEAATGSYSASGTLTGNNGVPSGTTYHPWNFGLIGFRPALTNFPPNPPSGGGGGFMQ